MITQLRLTTSRSPFIRGGVTVNRLGVELDAGSVTAPQLLAILRDENIAIAQRSDPDAAFVPLTGEDRARAIVFVETAIGESSEIVGDPIIPLEQDTGSMTAATDLDPAAGAADGGETTPAAPATETSAKPADVIPADKAPASKPSGRKPKS